jgi:hypothetical protein
MFNNRKEMKTYHKYRNGYINIDDTNIYLTSTGNWSEVETLSEKKVGKSTKRIGKIIGMYILLAFVSTVVICIFASSERQLLFKLFSLAGGIFGVIKLYHYFNTETGERFYIPKSKVIRITPEKNNFTIEFRSETVDQETIHIVNVEGDVETVMQKMLQRS